MGQWFHVKGIYFYGSTISKYNTKNIAIVTVIWNKTKKKQITSVSLLLFIFFFVGYLCSLYSMISVILNRIERIESYEIVAPNICSL